MTPVLAVLAKAPEPGRVKTRLCPPFGPRAAAELAEAALADTLRAARGVPGVDVVCVLDGRPGPWLPAATAVLPQRTGPLAARLAGAFADCGQAGRRPVLLIGMDTPQVGSARLGAALAALAGAGAVLGRSSDGGWWALGLRRPDPALVAGVPTSTPWTGELQYQQLRGAGLRVAHLEVLRDVDTAADADRVAAVWPHTAFARRYRVLRGDGAGRAAR